VTALIVEDDASVARFLHQAMSEAGYAPTVAEFGADALDLALARRYDVILLDITLPGMDGLEVCRRLRLARISSPILMITARDTLNDKVIGLDSGADDYLVKPFQVAELLARIRALLRRGTGGSAELQVADVTLDPASRTVRRAGSELPLSATEYALLEYLMRNAGRTLTRSMILEHVWQYDFDGNDNVLDVYVSYLRKKLDRDRSSSLIQTVRGVGYRMTEPARVAD